MGLKDQFEAIKKQAAEKKAAEAAKSAEYEMLEASLSEAEKEGEGAEETIKNIEDAGELDPEMAEQMADLKSKAEMAIDKIANLKSELERVKAELGGAESAEPVAEPAQAGETAEVAPAEVAVEEKVEAPKTPEESLENLKVLYKEISAIVKESQQIDFEKIENADQKLSELRSSREKILAAMNDAIEAHQSAGNLEGVKRLLSQSQTAIEKLKIDDAIDMYARKANGLVKERKGGETQLQTEYSGKEVEIIMKRLELDAKMIQGDNRDKEIWLLGNINRALGSGGISSKLSPDAIKIFEDRKNAILKNNIQQASHFDKLASETMSERIGFVSNFDAQEADAMAKVNRALETSKRDAEKRRAE